MSTPTLLDALRVIIDPLDEAGIRWTTDLQKLNAPCVFVPVPTLTFRFGRDALEASFTPVAIVQNTGNRVAIELLSELIEKVQTALKGAATTSRPVDVSTADQSGVLLGAEMPFTVTLKAGKP